MKDDTQPTPELGIQISPDIFARRDKWNYMMMGATVIALARFPEVFNPDLSLRDILPEPLDVPDHIGNVAGMAMFAFPALSGWLKAGNEQATSREWFNRDLRRTQILIGGITLAANVFGELVGYGPTSTPDPVDAVYGLAGGYVFYRACKPVFLPESEVDNVMAIKNEIGDDVEFLEPEYQEVITRFDKYKRRINQLRHKLTKPPQKLEQKQSPSMPRTAPKANKRYTPPKKKI